jgi:hypothetical protein
MREGNIHFEPYLKLVLGFVVDQELNETVELLKHNVSGNRKGRSEYSD